jgi:magnesium transporter
MIDVEETLTTVIDLTPEELDERVHELLDEGQFEELRILLADQYSQDIADVIERMDDVTERYALFSHLSPDAAAEVIDEISRYTAHQILSRMPTSEAARFLNRMEMDDLVEILADELEHRQEEILAQMHPKTAQEIRDLLIYPEDSAGRLMTRKFVRVNQEMTAAEIIAHIRKTNQRYETIADIYVLDPASRLLGVASLREILNARPATAIKEFMVTDPTTIAPDAPAEEAARVLARYDFLALPVVTPDEKMLGIITVDDAIDVLTAAQTSDLLSIGGLPGEAGSAPYFTVPILRVIRQRLVWLILLFVGGSITSGVLETFSVELGAVVALSFYIPLLIGTGGNTGSQTVSMIIRGMTTNDIRSSDVFRVARRELASGVILGLLLGAIAYFRVVLQEGQETALPLVVAVSVIAVCTWSNVIAAVIPMVARRFKIDPALISAPLISTTVDATGLLIYMLIAKAMLVGI